MVRVPAVEDLGFDSLFESDQMTLKVGIHRFSAWRSALKGKQACNFSCSIFEGLPLPLSVRLTV